MVKCEDCIHESECRESVCFYDLLEKERLKIAREIIREFNLRCEIEMNAHNINKRTKPLNLEKLHKVRDVMLKGAEG